MLKAFANQTFLLLAVVISIVVVILAVDMGLVTDDARSWQRGWFHYLETQYGLNADSIDRAIKVIGLAVSTVLGALGFSRAWHYAERKLPARIDDFLNRVDQRHLSARRALLAPYSTRVLKDIPAPKPEAKSWRRLFPFVGKLSARAATDRALVSLAPIDDEIGVLNRKRASCDKQKATRHLLRGMEFTVDAASMEPDSENQRDKNREALREFEEVLKLDESDLDALEQAARQCNLLNAEPAALLHLRKMARAAAATDQPIRQARALRFLAEILAERSTMPAWTSARATLVSALEVLKKAVGLGREKEVELAHLYESLCAVQIKREKYTAAEEALYSADHLYGILPPPEGPEGEGKARVKKLREDLNRAKRDKEEEGA